MYVTLFTVSINRQPLRETFFIFIVGLPFGILLPGSYIRFCDDHYVASSGPKDYIAFENYDFFGIGFVRLIHRLCNPYLTPIYFVNQ